jgi:U3 small nucleolar RNA-associated protein 5
MGTASGSILLYSVAKGDLQSEMAGGHRDVVHGVCWDDESDLLYSCSSDQHVYCWSISTGNIKCKWKADKSSVYSIALTADRKGLVTASRSIKLWDIESQTMVKKFTGHATEVFFLRCLSVPSGHRGHHQYIVSAAVSDRVVHAWSMDKGNSDQNAVASFSLSDEAVHLDVSLPQARGESVLMTVVTKQGSLHLFDQQFNGRQKKPLVPKVTVQVGGTSITNNPLMLPILSAKLLNVADHTFIFAHGSFLKLTFERKSLEECDDTVMFLVRDTVVTSDTQIARNKLQVPQRSRNLKHVAPELAPQLQRGDKRKGTGEVTMEDKLTAVKAMTTQVQEFTSDKGLTHLLVQGLQSMDTTILDNVLFKEDKVIVHRTVGQLPLQAIVPLLEELNRRIRLGGPKIKCHLMWLKYVLTSHMSFLTTHPRPEQFLEPLHHMFEQRCSLYETISRLKGRMDLVLSQVKSMDSMSEEPALLYIDESEDDIFDEELDGTADQFPEKMWEELSHGSEGEDEEGSMEGSEDDLGGSDGGMEEGSDDE